MIEAIDQAFVNLKHWIVGLFPAGVQPLVSVVFSIVPIMVAFPTLFAITTWLERKGLGRIQNRIGPNRVGPFGWFQPVADGIKAIIKEDVVPRSADKLAHFFAPVLLVIPVFLGYSVLPCGRNMVAIDLESGVLFFFAVGAATELAVFLAGWSSHNKYSMLGAMRAIAQMISYELPLILSTIPVIMLVGTLSTVEIVEAQSGYFAWHVFTPWGLAGFLLFLIAATAESNRSPFDLPEAESELIAGYFIEYSGFKFALFFLGEYLGLFAVSGLGVTLFLGGYQAPVPFLDFIPSYVWFFGKLLCLIALFIWVRGTLPRLRIDQLMNFAWKFMLPMTLINIVAAAVWHFTPGTFGRWLSSGAIVLAGYIFLGRGLSSRKNFAPRVYRYAS